MRKRRTKKQMEELTIVLLRYLSSRPEGVRPSHKQTMRDLNLDVSEQTFGRYYRRAIYQLSGDRKIVNRGVTARRMFAEGHSLESVQNYTGLSTSHLTRIQKGYI